MGEYYNWVNIDKCEYICPGDFDYGNTKYETIHKESVPLWALYVLLDAEWKGDRVIWLGDEGHISVDSSNEVIKLLYKQTEDYGHQGDYFDMICEMYRNVSCYFKSAETRVRKEIGYYLTDLEENVSEEYRTRNEYCIDKDHPFDNLFQKAERRYQYTINHTKKIYYSLDKTKILYLNLSLCDYADPLPILLGYGNRTEPGLWLGDIVGVSDSPPENYILLEEVYLDW